MQTDDLTADVDAKVRRWILKRYKAEHISDHQGPRPHLQICEQAEVAELDGGDGTYDSTTGDEYVTLEATVRCPHGRSEEYKYGKFGDLAWMIEDL